jgi:hypothetical protein
MMTDAWRDELISDARRIEKEWPDGLPPTEPDERGDDPLYTLFEAMDDESPVSEATISFLLDQHDPCPSSADQRARLLETMAHAEAERQSRKAALAVETDVAH